jgi:hypothetical protein
MAVTQEIIEKCLNDIDELSAPDKMSQEQAKEFLEAIIGDLMVRVEAIDQDLQNSHD